MMEAVATALDELPLLQEKAKKPLRVTCYGSSSAKTPPRFCKEAYTLGYILAKRGHVCINGAGSFGCMAALNDGACNGNGDILGVIHEMFLVDGGDWLDRDGHAHKVFSTKPAAEGGPKREILIASGNDLQERKRLLVEHADGLIVLPGGPGTWDELWEMACARNLGMTTLPIVCVDVDGYYAPFRTMLENGYKHDLIKHKPDEIISFVSTSEEAVVWLEKEMSKPSRSPKPKLKRRLTKLKRSSFLSEPVTENYHHAAPASKAADEHSAHDASRRSETNWMHIGMSFIAGVSLGMLITVTKPHK